MFRKTHTVVSHQSQAIVQMHWPMKSVIGKAESRLCFYSACASFDSQRLLKMGTNFFKVM